jgi:hypothetical protein
MGREIVVSRFDYQQRHQLLHKRAVEKVTTYEINYKTY